MRVFYDDPAFDYQKYWSGREYEDQAERIALRRLFQLIPQTCKENIIDIAGGFGRLTPEYANLFKSCLLVDPSKKLLNKAQKLSQKYQNLSIKKAFVEKLPVEDDSFDVSLLIRILHHLTDLGLVLKEINRALKPGGFLILEFANKIRFKNVLKAILSFNFNFFTNHRPADIGNKEGVIPFFSYHPNQVKTLLLANGFEIKKTLSVSNFRHPLIKKIIPLKILLILERIFSFASGYLSILRFFGPSIFILAQKR